MPTIDVTDLRPTIVPKSDQLNAEQLLGTSMTLTVTGVQVSSSPEQPVVVHYEDEQGRPFKPCKTMRKILVFAWGQDGNEWAGKSMTVYNDPSVKFGGDEVGGIRISHLSHIPKAIEVSLTSTRGKKALYRAGLLERGQVDRYEDGEQSDRDAQAIIDASRPAPLTWDSAYVKRPHIRAGEKP